MRRSLALLASIALGCAPASASPDAAVSTDAWQSADAGESFEVGPSTDATESVDAGLSTDARESADAGEAPDALAHDTGVAATLADVLGRATFDAMFLHRADPACSAAHFDYDAFVAAAARFPAFLAEGSLEDRRREAAAFLANASHETTGGWPTAPDGPQAWGLCFAEEVGCASGGCTGYCDPSRYPCTPGQTYHGRGPLQLSWNYNYAQAGEALALPLLTDPGLAARDGEVAWRTAIWFWMTPQAPKPSCHDVMVGRYTPSAADLAAGRLPGFGLTVNIINGGLECGRPGDARVADRVAFYLRYTDLLSVAPGPDLDCATMRAY